MLLPHTSGPSPRYRTSSITQYNKWLSSRLHHNPQLAVHPLKPLPTRADDDLLLVARSAELSIPATDSLVLSTSVAGGAGLKRVVRVGRTVGTVSVGAPALAVEVANLSILDEKIQISIQHSIHPVVFLENYSPSKRSSASHLGRGTGTTGQPGW
jgi:hypothetical protein